MICKRCGTEINTKIREADGSVVCPGCGAVYRSKSTAKQAQVESPAPRCIEDRATSKRRQPKRPNKGLKTGLLVLLILIIAGGIGSALLNKKNVSLFSRNKITEFNVSWSSFAVGESEEIIFTAQSVKAPNLFVGSELIGEMRDDGNEGDKTAGDGVFSYLISVSSDTEKVEQYFAGFDRPVTEAICLFFYDKPTDDEVILFRDAQSAISQMDSQFADVDGYISENDINGALKAVADYSEQLISEGVVTEYHINEDNVFIRFSSGLSTIYIPNIEGNLSGNDDVQLSLLTYEPFKNEFPNVQVDDIAYDITQTLKNCTLYTRLDNDLVTLDSIKKDFGPNQVVLWIGHGTYDDSNHSYVMTGEQNLDIFLYWEDFISGRITTSFKNRIAFSSGFIKKYCGRMDHSLIYLNCCLSGKDDVLANTFLDKGAAAVICNTETINANYAHYIQIRTMDNMQTINPDTERYYTLAEALFLSKKEFGYTDIKYNGKGAETVIKGDYNYRLSDFVNDGEKENYSTLNEYIIAIASQCVDDFSSKVAAASDFGDSAEGAELRQMLSSYSIQCQCFSSAAIFSSSGKITTDFILNYTYYMYSARRGYTEYSENLNSMLTPYITGSIEYPCPSGWTSDVNVVLGSSDSKTFLWITIAKEGNFIIANYVVLEMNDDESIMRYWDIIDRYNTMGLYYEIMYASPYGTWDRIGKYTNIVKSDDGAYQAYLSHLEQERDAINAYYWQKGYYGSGTQTEDQIPHPVVFCDVYGDDTPEMIYIKRADDADYWAHIEIVTFDGGQVHLLYSSIWDTQVAGGQGYYFYQRNGEKTLYLYDSTGDDWWKNTYYYAEENADGSLSFAAYLQRDQTVDYSASTFIRNVDYIRNGESISEDEFAREEANIQANTACILIYNAGAGEFAKSYTASHGCPAMTCDEAITFLKRSLGIEIESEPISTPTPITLPTSAPTNTPSISWSDAYKDFVLNKKFLNYGDSTAGYGDLENSVAVITFALHDMNSDTEPELIIFNGFNGRDLQANYVFTYTGSEIAYCGTTLASAYAVDGYPGLFSSSTSSGWYLDEQYAGQYAEVTYLDYHALYGDIVTKESVSVTGLPISEGGRVVISRTANNALYEASQSSHYNLTTMTWQQLNSNGWDSFAATYSGSGSLSQQEYLTSASDLTQASIENLCAQVNAVISNNVANSWGRTENLESSSYVGCYVLSNPNAVNEAKNYVIIVFKNDVLISIPNEGVNKQLSYYYTLTYNNVSIDANGNCLLGSYLEPDNRVLAGIPGHNYYYNGYDNLEVLYNYLIQPKLSDYDVTAVGSLRT